MKIPSDPVERNLRGVELEKEGSEDDAIECYEANVREGFQGTHPYERLAVLYRSKEDFQREVEVLERAIEVFGANPSEEAQASKFKARLVKAKALAAGERLPVVRKPHRPAMLDSSGEHVCSTKGCGKYLSGAARRYCDECREVRAAPNTFREGDLAPSKLFFPVVGTRYRLKAAKQVRPGEPLFLVRDPEHPQDRNAIEVRRHNGDLIGYVPKEGFLQGRWGYRPYTQLDLVKALDAGAVCQLTCYAAGGRIPGSVQAEGHCGGWMVPHPARLEVWAERGTRVNGPPDPLPFVLVRSAYSDVAETQETKNARPWWKRIFGR
jgi:tetratricopeptide (TPR) repeat protein